MAEAGHLPGQKLFKLYETWAEGGTGLLITGNVMVDHRAMTGPGGVSLEADTPLEPFKNWAASGRKNGTQLWMQINHPGRQVFASMGGLVLSPSDVALDLGAHSHLFSRPNAMTEDQIKEVVQRFTTTASRAVEAGFNGIQVHAAHGYLLSQFLSPLTNRRTDNYGGSLENRARILEEIVKAIRTSIPAEVPVAVKLNSADFQRGGFEAKDAHAVVLRLGELGVDLVELSGGSYESPAMQGKAADGSTLAREAYFLSFAKDIAAAAPMPIMTTGGISRLPVAEQVLSEGVDLVGMGTALAFTPDLPNLWRDDPGATAPQVNVNWKNSTLASLAAMAVIKRQLQRMGDGRLPKAKVSPLFSLVADRIRLNRLTKIYRAAHDFTG